MTPDASRLILQMDLTLPLLGFYDAPDTKGFEPLVSHPTTDFKSAAIDHSASPPQDDIISSGKGIGEAGVR